jgi:Dockerin type I domain
VAVDSVGNAEAHPTAADATTEVLSIKGDTDGSGQVDLADVIVSLQTMSNLQSPDPGPNICADVDGDGRIGMPEILYVLQHVAGLR